MKLWVKDKEIHDHYNMMRATEFNKYSYPIYILACLYVHLSLSVIANVNNRQLESYLKE